MIRHGMGMHNDLKVGAGLCCDVAVLCCDVAVLDLRAWARGGGSLPSSTSSKLGKKEDKRVKVGPQSTSPAPDQGVCGTLCHRRKDAPCQICHPRAREREFSTVFDRKVQTKRARHVRCANHPQGAQGPYNALSCPTG